jgi:hypothetical protein
MDGGLPHIYKIKQHAASAARIIATPLFRHFSSLVMPNQRESTEREKEKNATSTLRKSLFSFSRD